MCQCSVDDETFLHYTNVALQEYVSQETPSQDDDDQWEEELDVDDRRFFGCSKVVAWEEMRQRW